MVSASHPYLPSRQSPTRECTAPGKRLGTMGDGWMMRREGVWSMEHANRFCGSLPLHLSALTFKPPPSLPPFKFRFEDGNLSSPLLGMQTTWRGSCWTWHRLLPSLSSLSSSFAALARSICFLTPSSSAPFTISLSFLASCSRSLVGRLSPSSPYITKPTLPPPPSFILATTSSPHGSPCTDGMGGGGGSFV